MKLTELDPRWWVLDKTRHGLGVNFLCPCCRDVMISVAFENPLDGGPKSDFHKIHWQRIGDTFETLSLQPSIRFRHAAGEWHGYITNGEIITV